MQVPPAFLQKYNRPVPRYTSYPTVPFWKDHIDVSKWKQVFRDRFAECNGETGISLYIHLPFCESLCIYCGCNKKISTNHRIEEDYLQVIFTTPAHLDTLYELAISDLGSGFAQNDKTLGGYYHSVAEGQLTVKISI